MTIVTTIIERTEFGNKKIVMGASTNDSTGGEIVTGLKRVEGFVLTSLGSSAVESSVNETFPLEKGEVTIVTENNVDVSWIAIGI